MFTSSAIAAALLAIAPASAAVIDVFVGGVGVLKFTPEHVTAHPGDSIRFTFGAKNHTVTQSSFDSPCSPLTDAHGMHSGFFSGYMPVAADQKDHFPQFWIPVTDTKPIWAYCQQGNHCQQGMVFAVNAPASPSEKSFDNWKSKAVGKAAGDPYASVAPTSSAPYGYGDYPAATTSAHAVTSSAPAAATGDPAIVTVTKVIALPSSTWTTVYGSYPGSADPTPAVQPVVHKVIVGGTSGNIFSPSSVMAQPADIITFEFHAKNHTVTQSTFKTPCTKKADGMDSGFVPTAVDATSFTTWNVTVTGTEPLWFYCAQGNHCASGMVFSVNAVESSQNNFDAFQSQAKALAQNGAASPTGSGAPASTTSAITNGAAARIGSSGMGGATVITIAFALFGAFMVC